MDEKSPDTNDLVWGADEIAAVIRRTVVSTYKMLERDELPAKKVGGKWVASRRRLIDRLIGEAA